MLLCHTLSLNGAGSPAQTVLEVSPAQGSDNTIHPSSRMPWWSRALVRLMDPITALRRMNRILLYRF